ncbi:MAG: DUF4381 domain-containing protein [Planctomycetota bacterium]
MNRLFQAPTIEEPPATSLDRLHDIVLPDPVPWWPPAPIWYVIIFSIVMLIGVATYLAWRKWRINAYRRVAVRALMTTESIAEVSSLLRRVALSFSSRASIASLQGENWCDWLDQQVDSPMSESTRQQLTEGVYGRNESPSDLQGIRQYALDWIRTHRVPAIPADSA